MRSPIVVPTDFSAAAAEAYAYALRVARATGSGVHLFHAISWPHAGPFEVPGDAPTAAQESAEEVALAREALAELAGGDRADVRLVARHSNVPASEITDYARTVGAGLVVLGMCGQRPRLHTLGAVAAEVIHTAPCDVLLVPHREGAPYSATAPGRVLVPVDFSSASRPLVAFAFALARDLGASGIDLVHVLEPLPHPVRWIDEAFVDLVPEIRQRAEAALRELADDVGGAWAEAGAGADGPDLALYVERGKAARTLARAAEALGSALVVVGPHAERPVFDRFLGHVAEGLARRVRCPILVARRSAAPGPLDEPPVDPRSYERVPAWSDPDVAP